MSAPGADNVARHSRCCRSRRAPWNRRLADGSGGARGRSWRPARRGSLRRGSSSSTAHAACRRMLTEPSMSVSARRADGRRPGKRPDPGRPYCCGFGVLGGNEWVPGPTPTRSAVVITSQARHRSAASEPISPSARAHGQRRASWQVGRRPHVAESAAAVTGGCPATEVLRRRGRRCFVAHRDRWRRASAPRCRARREPGTGNGESIRPRPNSGHDRDVDPGCLVGAQGPPPGGGQLFVSQAIRDSSSRAATEPGPRSSARSAAASRSCCCSAVRRTSMALLPVPGAAPARRQARDLLDENDVPRTFVGPAKSL